LCLSATTFRIDLNELAERYAASSSTLVVYTSLVCSTAAGLPEGPFSSLRQSVPLRLTRCVVLPIHQLTFQLT